MPGSQMRTQGQRARGPLPRVPSTRCSQGSDRTPQGQPDGKMNCEPRAPEWGLVGPLPGRTYTFIQISILDVEKPGEAPSLVPGPCS